VNAGLAYRRFFDALSGALLGLAISASPVLGFQTAQQTTPPPPTAADVLFKSGVTLLSEKKYQEAEDAFRKLHELEPDKPRGIGGVAEVYVAQGRTAEALGLLEAEAGKNPARLDLRVAIGNVAVRTANYDRAIAEYQKVLDLVDRNSAPAADIYVRMAEAYRRKRDPDFAIALLRQAKRLLPANAIVANALAFTLDSAGHKTAADAEFKRVVELQPDNPVVLNNVAFRFAEGGRDLDAALSYARRAAELAPGEVLIADTLGWVYVKKNMADQAIAILRNVVQKAPRPLYRYHLAVALAQKGDRTAAIAELESALSSKPSKDDEQKIRELLQKMGR
jgi:tetratricopeptide (TPR) repeat protein